MAVARIEWGGRIWAISAALAENSSRLKSPDMENPYRERNVMNNCLARATACSGV